MGGETSRVQTLVDEEFKVNKSMATPSSVELVRSAVFDRSHIAAVTMSHLVRQTLVLNQIESLRGVKFPDSVTRIPVFEGIIAPQTCKSAPVSFLLLKMAIKIPLRFIIITPMYTSHAHLLQDRNPLTSVEGSCFPSQLVFLSLVRAFVASSSHQCHELHTPVRMPELTPRFLFVFSLAFMCILNRH